MHINVIGTAGECEAAIIALDLLLDVRETSAPRPAGDGLVQVDAVVADPTSSGYGAGEPDPGRIGDDG